MKGFVVRTGGGVGFGLLCEAQAEVGHCLPDKGRRPN